MTPAELDRIAESLGGPRSLASLLRVGKDWVYRRISGETPIEHVDVLAIRQALGKRTVKSKLKSTTKRKEHP
jgi:hypothetical protein